MDFHLPTVPSSLKVSFSRGGKFPQEILAEFAEYLPRECLLNLSLASRSLREEAQRVLFRVFDYSPPQEPPKSSDNVDNHRIFLHAILNSPTRLGPHVRTYTSRFVALVPPNSDEYDEQYLVQSHERNSYWGAGGEIWNLTFRALPFLTQLKHLSLFLGTDGRYEVKDSEPSPFRGTSILRRCTFKLDSFSWAERHGLQNGVSDLEEFLSRQPNLKSLNLITTYRNLWYSDDIPQLRLASNTLSCLRRVIGPSSLVLALSSEGRPIDTLFLLESWHSENSILENGAQTAHKGIKFLSLPDTGTLRTLCPTLSSIETLHIKKVLTPWQEDMSVLTHLKSLRTLILEVNSGAFGSLYLADPAHSTSQIDPVLRIAALAFESCADTLQIVHFALRGLHNFRIISVDKTGHFQTQKVTEFSDLGRFFQLWISPPQPRWADVEEYFGW